MIEIYANEKDTVLHVMFMGLLILACLLTKFNGHAFSSRFINLSNRYLSRRKISLNNKPLTIE